MSQGQCPQTQVGGGVGHTAKHELDGLDQLVDKQLVDRMAAMDFILFRVD